jgi:hypothetical protein
VQVAPLLPVVVRVDGDFTIDSPRAQGRITTATHIVSGRKVFPFRAQYHDPYIGVFITGCPRLIEFLEYLRTLSVGRLRAIQGDHGNAIPGLISNKFG